MNSTGSSTSRKVTGISIAILAGALIFIFWSYLFTYPTPLIYPNSDLGTDLNREVWPLARYMVDWIQSEGVMPLWRTYHLSGAPIAGHPVAPVFYPPAWIVLIFPLPMALNLLAVTHLGWCSLGTYSFLQATGKLRWQACLAGALVFAVSPRWIAVLSGGHWPSIMSIAWWPWIWLAFIRFWQTRLNRWAVFLGVCLAAQALTDGRYLFISLLCLVVATLATIRWKEMRAWVWNASRLGGLAALFGIGLSAVQLFPFFELLPYSSRSALSGSEAAAGSLPIGLVLGAILPSGLKFPEWYIYAGAVAVLLLAWSAAAGLSRTEKIAWGVVILGTLVSFGSDTPFYDLLLRRIPGFQLFRIPARWWLVSLSGLAFLAAWAVEKWLGGAGRNLKAQRITLTALAVFYLCVAAVRWINPGMLPFDLSPVVVLLVGLTLWLLLKPARWSWLLLAFALTADSWIASRSLIQPVREAAILHSGSLHDVLEGSTGDGARLFAPYTLVEAADLVKYDLSAADGYDSFQLAGYAGILRLASGCNFAGYAVTAPATQSNPEAVIACPEPRLNLGLLAALNVQYLLLTKPDESLDLAPAKHVGDYWVYTLGEASGRGFGVVKIARSSPEACLDTLASIDARSAAVVEETPPAELSGKAIRVTALEKDPNREAFRAKTDGPFLFIRSESWAPGWMVTVDGQAGEVLRVDCALQGVWVGSGEHEIRFEYMPRGFIIGRAVSLASLLCLFGYALFLMFPWKRTTFHKGIQHPED